MQPRERVWKCLAGYSVPLTLAIGIVFALTRSEAPALIPTAANAAEVAARASADYGRLPLHFEANRGQVDESVQFLARGPGYHLFLTRGDAVFALRQPTESGSGEDRGGKGLRSGAMRETASADPAAEYGKASAIKNVTVLRMQLVDANPQPTAAGVEVLPGKANYFLGNDPAKWKTDIPTYGKVRYEDVYPGVDLVYYGTQQHLEYDFVVAPGGDPRHIRLRFDGTDALDLDPHGDLLLRTMGGEVRQRRPVIYQEINGERHEIAGRYVLRDEREVGFEVGAYDASRPLIIDPVLLYSTYLGGSGEVGQAGYAIAVDGQGQAYVMGSTASADFPTTAGAFDTTCGTDARCNLDAMGKLQSDAFIIKLSAAGNALVYSTFLGGSKQENPYATADRGGNAGIAVDGQGHAYVTGFTQSPDFPITQGAFQQTLQGGQDTFVAKLSPAGNALIYSTYLGGSGRDRGMGIALEPGCPMNCSAYITGETDSTGDISSTTAFPTTPGAFQRTSGGRHDAFVTKLSPTGGALVYSTYLGGSDAENDFTYGAGGIAVDGQGHAYVMGFTRSPDFPITQGAFQQTLQGGQDTFVAKLSPAGNALIYSTYLGGSGIEHAYGMAGIAVDGQGHAYVTGDTGSADFPLVNPLPAPNNTLRGALDIFVTKLNAAGNALIYSTYLGGSLDDSASSIKVDGQGQAHIAGVSESVNFPVVNGLPSNSLMQGSQDAIVAKLNAAGNALIYSTYLGGGSLEWGHGVAVDAQGNTYVTGFTTSNSFPLQNPLPAPYNRLRGGWSAFVAKLGESSATPTPTRTATRTPTATATRTPTPTSTRTLAPTGTPSPAASATPTGTAVVGLTFHTSVVSVNPTTGGVTLQPIAPGSCPRPLNNCLEFTITGSFTIIGNIRGLPPGFTPTLQIPTVDLAGNPTASRAATCSSADTTGTSTCNAIVPDPGVLPQSGGTVVVVGASVQPIVALTLIPSNNVAQIAASLARDGQPGVPCASTLGDTCQIAGGLTGTARVTGSMAVTVTAPAGVIRAGAVANVFFVTTTGVENVVCPVAIAGTPTTCTGALAGHAQQDSTARMFVGGAQVAAGTIRGPGLRTAVLPLLPPPILLPPPAAAAPPFLAPPSAGLQAEVPVIPEGETSVLLGLGLAVFSSLIGVSSWRHRKPRGHPD